MGSVALQLFGHTTGTELLRVTDDVLASSYRSPLSRVSIQSKQMSPKKTEFSSYADDRRQTPIDGFDCHPLPYFTRYTPKIEGMEGFVVFSRLPAGKETEIIRHEIDYFQQLGIDFEWKVYDFDEPENLKSTLEREGFTCGESEAFMLCATDEVMSERNLKGQAQIERVQTLQGLQDIAKVQQIVWNQNFDWLVEQLSLVLETKPGELSLYCAYVDGDPIGSGWTSFPPNSQYPELHGGAVIPTFRGQGIYGDLYQVRCQEISARGYLRTSVDATEMSRPILESLGFKLVCMTHPMRYSCR